MSLTNYGSGSQNIVGGNGPQSNLNGSGSQDNNHGFPHSASSHGHRLESPVSTGTRPSCREDFQIALICALPLEYDAVVLQFDEFWDEEGQQYGRASGDTNTYTTGRVGVHNVVLALLPNMGKASAAGAAASLRSSYPRLKLALLVGICGGVPGTDANEALLGDVVISKTILQFDFGRQFASRFVIKNTIDDNLGRANKDIRGLVTSFESEVGRERLQAKAGEYLRALQDAAAQKQRRQGYQYPGVLEDKLFAAGYRHKHRTPQSCVKCEGEGDGYCEAAAKASCAELNCNEGHLVSRQRLAMKQSLRLDDMQCPEILVGRIASGDTVMKSGERRDELAREWDVIAFEMEGAGTWDEVPCIIIKGICDYADSHKNKLWQPFAAATAASVMKAVLGRYHG